MASSSLKSLAVPVGIEPMEAKLVDELPEEPGWQFEPKWDGFRCLAFRAGDEVDLRAKSGKPLGRYFPEIVAKLARDFPPSRFVIDGELAIPVGDTLSFDALQMRLHPAESRIRSSPPRRRRSSSCSTCCCDPAATALSTQPLRKRRAALEALLQAAASRRAACGSRPARASATEARGLARQRRRRAGRRGRQAARRRLSARRARHAQGQATAHRRLRGRRLPLRAGSREVGSLLLGLYDDGGKLDHVGFTSTITDAERPALTERLEELIAPPGFTGNAPGGPSRWSTERSGEWEPLKPKLVVEVRYDHVTGDRFRHGTKLIRWRPDKAPRQCTFEQIAPQTLPRNVKLLLG